jgi:hypothetical protein
MMLCLRGARARSNGMRLWVATALLVVLLSGNARTAQAARRGPYLQNLQTDRVTICWETPQPQKGEVRLLDSDGKPLKPVPTADAAARHEVVVDGLVAGRKYSYEVVVGDNAKSIGKGTFLSAPAKGQPFSFVAWGDSREGAKTSARLASQILRTGAGMCLHTGDLVSDGKRLDQWDGHLFVPCAELMRNLVLWPAVGNHDKGMMPDGKTNVFRYMFSLPDNETFYSFDYGDAHFVVLDTTSPLDRQVEFIKQDLAKTQAKWRFAMWHDPPFSSSVHPSHIQARKQVLPILARYNVDMIIVGHNHNFMLSKPIRHVYEKDQERPYVQLVTGGGGAYPADFKESDRWFERGFTAYHFVLIEIDGDKLSGKAIDQGGRVLHSFEIDRSMRNAVAFELIELERYLNELNIQNTNVEGWPTGLLLGADQQSGRLVYQVKNPLRDPVKLSVRFDVSAGLEFDPTMREVEVAGNAETQIETSFQVKSAESLYPLKGPSVSLKTSLGDGELRMSPPPIGLGRKVVAGHVTESVSVDGEAKEPAWSRATEYGRFVRWATADLAYEAPSDQSTLRAVNDGEHLYLLLRRPIPRSGQDKGLLAEGDHFSVYLAVPQKAIGIRADLAGQHKFEGTKGLDEGITAAYSKNEESATWEMRIPLSKLREGLADPKAPLAFNVMEARGKEIYTLSPSFRQHPSLTNSAALVLE